MKTISHIWMVMIGALAVLLPGVAMAQISVSARLSPARAYVGDSTQLSIEVNGSKNPERPVIPNVPGLEFTFAGGQDTSRHSIMIINGRRTEEVFEGYVFQYRVTPTEAGRFTIPAIVVTVDGKEYRTEPLVLNAIEPGKLEGFYLSLEADKTTAYVGEAVKIRLTLYITQDVDPQRLTIPDAGGKFEILPAPAPDVRGRAIKLFNEPAVQGRGTLDGVPCVTATTDRYFVPRVAGSITLGPARIVMNVGDAFFGRAERHVIASNRLEFDVKPLPEPKPPGFTGLVGEYSVESSASATDVHVGDPITLTVMVQGHEPLESVPPIDFTRQPGFAGAFRASSEPSIPSIVTGGSGRAAVYTTTIRAESDDIREIPPVELPYFDTASGTYAVARSKPIPLKVHPTTEVALPQEASSSVAAKEDRTVGGLAPIVTSHALLTRGEFDLTRTLGSPAAIGALAGPALVYIGVAGVAALRRRAERDPARRRRHGARARAMRRLHRAKRRSAGPAEIGAALRGYVADWFDLPEAGITSAECAARLAGHVPEKAKAYGAILERCDAALYGGGAGAVTAEEAESALRELAQELESKQ